MIDKTKNKNPLVCCYIFLLATSFVTFLVDEGNILGTSALGLLPYKQLVYLAIVLGFGLCLIYYIYLLAGEAFLYGNLGIYIRNFMLEIVIILFLTTLSFYLVDIFLQLNS
jgi:hypothetical protein